MYFVCRRVRLNVLKIIWSVGKSRLYLRKFTFFGHESRRPSKCLWIAKHPSLIQTFSKSWKAAGSTNVVWLRDLLRSRGCSCRSTLMIEHIPVDRVNSHEVLACGRIQIKGPLYGLLDQYDPGVQERWQGITLFTFPRGTHNLEHGSHIRGSSVFSLISTILQLAVV